MYYKLEHTELAFVPVAVAPQPRCVLQIRTIQSFLAVVGIPRLLLPHKFTNTTVTGFSNTIVPVSAIAFFALDSSRNVTDHQKLDHCLGFVIQQPDLGCASGR
uniref:(northern house mosquito) hypothetical protein n=1 Tax=Culex pipiens TaxID=7175 RepID=A0A8D8AZF3_CULPI